MALLRRVPVLPTQSQRRATVAALVGPHCAAAAATPAAHATHAAPAHGARDGNIPYHA